MTKEIHLQSPSPEQDSPSPALQHFHIAVANIRIAALNPSAELLDPLLRRPGDSQGYLIREDVQHRHDHEGDLGELTRA